MQMQILVTSCKKEGKNGACTVEAGYDGRKSSKAGNCLNWVQAEEPDYSWNPNQSFSGPGSNHSDGSIEMAEISMCNVLKLNE